jgi:hypothetical protein
MTIAIVGAGIAGLNAARILKNSGFAVEIFEKSDRPGGRIKSDLLDGFTLDHGFQVINPAYSELIKTGVLPKLTFTALPKSVLIYENASSLLIGDPRWRKSVIKGNLSQRSGPIGEKIRFLAYLARKPEDTSLKSALVDCANFYEISLKPFLQGVFLMNPDEISNITAHDLIRWFIKGEPSLIRGGVGELSKALAEGLAIRYLSEVTSDGSQRYFSGDGELKAEAILIAVDAVTAAQLSGRATPEMNYSSTWYFAAPKGSKIDSHFRLGKNTPLINTLAISQIDSTFAPDDRELVSATTLEKLSEAELRSHLSQLWRIDTRDWRLIKRFDIAHSLPRFLPGRRDNQEPRIGRNLYQAGDYLESPSQQGALLSGRKAAEAIISDLSKR